MCKYIPPFKLDIACTCLSAPEWCAEDLCNALSPRRPGEKQYCVANIELAMQSLKAVGILKVTRECDGRLFYAVTESGRRKIAKAL